LLLVVRLGRVLVQLGDNMIDPQESGHAVLSQNFPQHLHDLFPAHTAPFNQAAHHPHVLDQRLAPAAGFTRLTRGLGGWLAHSHSHSGTCAVELPLFELALRLPVVGATAPRRFSLPVSLLAAKGTTQIPTPGIARIRDEEYPAMPAAAQPAASLRPLSQNRSQQPIILQHQASDRSLAVPVRAKLKSLRDLDCKKPRLWLRILKLLKLTISSSYTIDTSVPRL
jgi:hypothetical protein